MTDVFSAAAADSCVRWVLRAGTQISGDAELKRRGENEKGRFPQRRISGDSV